jgi:hypothetical protein
MENSIKAITYISKLNTNNSKQKDSRSNPKVQKLPTNETFSYLYQKSLEEYKQ